MLYRACFQAGAESNAAGMPLESELSILQNYNHNSPILENVRCLYPFAGQNESELPFQENEELEILGKPADDPEWERVKNEALSHF